MAERSRSTGGGRKIWIDGMRGLAMIFVIYGHLAKGWSEYFIFTSPIKIPLFFAITGYVFKKRDGDFAKFISNILIKIGIPWALLSLMPLKVLYRLVKLDFIGIGRFLVDFLTGKNFWYMPCCILAEILFFLILTRFEARWAVYVAAIAVSAVGFLLCPVNMGKLSIIRVAFIAQLFMLFGYSFRSWESRGEEKINEKVLATGCFLAYAAAGIISIKCYPGAAMDVHKSSYYNLGICLFMIFAGLLLVFLTFRRFYLRGGVLSFIGKNTLVFYIIGTLAKNAVVSILNHLGLPVPKNPAGWLFECVLVCIICSVVAVILNRFAPEVVGKKRIAKGQ